MKLKQTLLSTSLLVASLGMVGCASTNQGNNDEQTTTVTEKTLLPSALITRYMAPPVVTPKTFTLAASDNFAFDSDELSAKGKAQLDEAILKFSLTEMKGIQVSGHTDAVGPDEYNEALSQRRASAVKNYLVSRGVPAELITVKGMGEKMPIASNETAVGRAQNRRVEIEFTAQS